MESKILIGTSGWGYPEWKEEFYPKKLNQNEFFHYYSEIFYTTEINTTFYQIPSQKTVYKWAVSSPNDFLFSAKVPQDVTHKSKLNLENCCEQFENFLKTMNPLIEEQKLLAFLLQLPPSFTKKDHFTTLKEFIEYWGPSEDYERVVEFRHLSWMDESVFEYLKKNNISYCGVIEPLLPPRMDITNSNLIYIRFHGYGDKPWFNYNFNYEEIKDWAQKIEELKGKSKRIGIYFNNHFSGYAAKNSLVLMKELNVEPRNHPNKVNLIKIKKRSGEISKDQTSLEKFF